MDEGTKALTRGIDVKGMDAVFMEMMYDAARTFLKGKYPSLFEQERNTQWAVSTWSRKIGELNQEKKKRKRQRTV